MLTRTALALLLLFPATASAQDLDTAVSAVVRISGTRGATPVRGTGFVVGLERDKATIVTASHVIEGAQFEVAFAADPTDRFPPDGVLGMDAGNANGLAVFQVRGVLPAGVTTLSFEVESRPIQDTELVLVGFPRMELSPRTLRRRLSGWSGMLLLIDQGTGEGLSGGPVLQSGKVVGVVTATDDQTTYAVSSVVAQVALEGWRVRLGRQSGILRQVTTTASPPKPCVSGEESTEAGIIWVRICSGTFTMGSTEDDSKAYNFEKPAHQVTLREFWIGKTEITNVQYRGFDSKHQGEDRLPATEVSWTEAEAACKHFGGRLPTEAEWEYAARAGSQAPWSFGADEKKLAEYAWCGESRSAKPHPVGTKRPNAWGLHDMHGNVWEWIADWYAPYTSGSQTDPTGPKSGEYRVLRGGAFDYPLEDLRSANRDWNIPGAQAEEVGFRCARASRRQP